MAEQIWIDIIEIGRQVGVPTRTFIPPIPGETHAVTVQDWDAPSLQKAIDYLAPQKAAGGAVVLTGHVDAWIIIALSRALAPECEVFYGAGLDGPGAPPVATPLIQLPVGEKNPRLRFDYEMRIEGENCYLEYRVDDPDAPPGVVHTFCNDDLPELVLPEVPADKHLFLYAHACYYVQVNVTNSYMRYARSVSTAYLDRPEYRCAYSSDPALRPGDPTPRAV